VIGSTGGFTAVPMSPEPGDRDEVERHFAEAILALRGAAPSQPFDSDGLALPIRENSTLSTGMCLDLFDAQLASRHLDIAARWLQARGAGFYTIGSSGHEGNAAVAAALRLDDPALLHYRSGAFYLVRASQATPPHDGVRDVLLGLVAAEEEPIAGGRHKVFGNHALHVIPQTSTIASHLPRAVGLAFAIGRAAKLRTTTPWPRDAIVMASLGDASINHSTAAGAINAAAFSAFQRLPVPLLIVCEDNGIGISVRTPPGWIRAAMELRPSIAYFHADGSDVAETYDTALAAAAWVRERRAPAFLHLSMPRLGGHAGSDVESAYRDAGEIAASLAADPLVSTGRLLVRAGALTADEVIARYETSRSTVLAVAFGVQGAPRLATAMRIMAPLAPRRPEIVRNGVRQAAAADDRLRVFGGRLPEAAGPLTLAQSINAALADALATRPGMLVFGEDVARKGGVYGVTRGLLAKFGAGRVFDTLLDEQSILGLALGTGLAGMLPVPEIQYLAYLHNAVDQIRGEAATLSFFSQGQYRNPMVLRIAGLAYQKGFGGHFHNDNAIAALRDIPGLVIAVPARPQDAPPMLRTCLAAAEADGTVCVFLEPIALYHERDLHEEGDGAWLGPYAPPDQWAQEHLPIGATRRYGARDSRDGNDLTIITFGNGLRMSLRAAGKLRRQGISSRVIDLRWIAPLPIEDILREALATGRVLIADETRRTGGVSEGIITALAEGGFRGPVSRVTSADSFIPLGDAAYEVLLSQRAIESAARSLMLGTPSAPATTATPARPATAGRPAETALPARPAGPGRPGEPAPPGRPAEPGRLFRPAEPDGPARRGMAAPSVMPGEPRTPARPAEPGRLSEPGRPTRQPEPGRPTERDRLFRPAEPAMPTRPGEPASPGEPGQPGKAARPAEQGRRGEPFMPVTSAEPAALTRPTAPGGPTTSPGPRMPALPGPSARPAMPAWPREPGPSARPAPPPELTALTRPGSPDGPRRPATPFEPDPSTGPIGRTASRGQATFADLGRPNGPNGVADAGRPVRSSGPAAGPTGPDDSDGPDDSAVPTRQTGPSPSVPSTEPTEPATPARRPPRHALPERRDSRSTRRAR
jgi:2-oxoisovalerate dehydrogenase E1 component